MGNNDENGQRILLPHHVQQELCTTRPLYRQGRKLTAVKVYTVNNESQHLLIFQVPKINLSNELRNLCSKYGELTKIQVATDHQTEIFTECYHVHYKRIQSARIAKRFLDNKSFYGEVLHVCYAPEFETVSDTREKLQQRQRDVLSRLQAGPTALEYLNVQRESDGSSVQDRKRKYPALPITEKRLRGESSNDIWSGIPMELDPRISGTQDTKTGFRKHFEIPQPKGTEYGPAVPANLNKFSSRDADTVDATIHASETIRTTLLPTTVIKNYKHECTKRIVFRNNKQTEK